MDIQVVIQKLQEHWILLLFILLLSWYVLSAIYNLYLSPPPNTPALSSPKSPPSPPYTTPQPATATSGSGNAIKYMFTGKACRIQPNEIIFNTPSAYRTIYGHQANVRKADIYKVWRRNANISSTLTEVDKKVHARKKRLLTAAFSDTAIRSAETFICRHVDRFCELLGNDENIGKSRNMAQLSDWLVFDIMCDLSFGKSFDIKEPKSNPLNGIARTFDKYTAFTSNIGRSPFLPLWLWLKKIGLNTILEKMGQEDMSVLFTLIRENILRRMEEEASAENRVGTEEGRKDMFHYLFHNKDSKTGACAYTKDILPVEAGLLLTTALGSTTATTSAFCFYITRNQQVYRKLVTEIRSNFISADGIQSSTVLSSCRYLRACIDETLRMTPAAPGENLRCVLPGGQDIDGHHLPEGALVGVTSWSLFHDEEAFGDPWVFRPERWIIEEDAGISPESVAEAQAAFFPFSIGPVSCVGQRLARSIISITAAKILYGLDVVATPGAKIGEGDESFGWGRSNKKVFQVRDATFALRDGPMVQFTGKQVG